MNAYDDGSRSQVNAKDRYIESSGTPPGCRPNNIAFPVVSRTPTTGYFLCNPSGCVEVSQLYSSPSQREENLRKLRQEPPSKRLLPRHLHTKRDDAPATSPVTPSNQHPLLREQALPLLLSKGEHLMKKLNTKIGGAILTLAFIFAISAAAGMTVQAQYRDRDDRWSNNQGQNRDWRRERAERARIERERIERAARRENRNNGNYGNSGNYGNYGNYGNNGAYGNYGGYGNGSQVEANQGYQNGLSTGASDAQRQQSYSPQRSKYWKNASSQAFRSGFEQGYAQGYRQYAGNGNGGYGNTGNRSGSILGTIFGRP